MLIARAALKEIRDTIFNYFTPFSFLNFEISGIKPAMANEQQKEEPVPITTTLEENTPQLSTTISKQSFMEDAYLEDGPVFRATIKQLEDRTVTLKASLKRIIKSATASFEIRCQLTKIDENYIEALRDTHCIEPLMSHYLNSAWEVIKEERNRLDQSLLTQMLEPLKKLYEEDIKVAEFKRKQFDEESKDYYASLAKYLKSKKKGESPEEQKKQIQRKLKFDLARFDYLGFLLDLHGGKKENEILFYITDHTIRDCNYFESITNKIEAQKPALNEFIALMTENSKEQEITAQERALKRRELIESCNIDTTDQQKRQSEELPPHEIPELDSSSITSTTQSINNEDLPTDSKFKGIRDLDPSRDQSPTLARKKEGFLFATSKPAKSTGGFDVKSTSLAWHK